MYEPSPARLERQSDKEKTKQSMTDPASCRKFKHSPLARQSPRRLLLPQHPDILPPLRPRYRRLGIPRLPRLGLLNLQPTPRQHSQHRATSPFPPPQPTLQRLGRILLHRLINPRSPRLQPRNRPEWKP